MVQCGSCRDFVINFKATIDLQHRDFRLKKKKRKKEKENMKVSGKVCLASINQQKHEATENGSRYKISIAIWNLVYK